RVRAPHHVDRRRPDDLLHAGQRADHAQRIARRAGDVARLVAADVDLRDLRARRTNGGLVPLARRTRREAEDLDRVGRARRAGVDGAVGRVVLGGLDLYVVPAGRDAQLELSLGVAVAGGRAVDGDRRARQWAARAF